MQNQKGVSTIAGITIFVVVAVFAFGGVFAYEYYLKSQIPNPNDQQNSNDQNQTACTMEAKVCPDGSSVGRTGPNCEFTECPKINEEEYSFIAIEEGDLNIQQYFDYYVGIYKNGNLLKKVNITNTRIKPSLFALSPDKKYVAFKTAIVGGTCVYKASPTVIDLSDFSLVNLDDSDINKKIKNVLGINPSEVIKFSSTEEVKDIKWVSNSVVEVSMQFGDNSGCPITYANKPSNSPNYVEAKVNFVILK